MVLEVIQYIAGIWYLAVYVVRLTGVYFNFRRYLQCRPSSTAKSTVSPAKESMGVTILRPMKGTNDPDLYECLKSSFLQTHQPIQILMCVTDPQDPSVAVANRLIAEFPSVEARILTGPDPNYGINPKVNNLVKGYKAAKHDIIWTLDSNITISADALQRALGEFDQPSIQLVHHVPIAIAKPGAGWGGLLDEMYMLTAHGTFYSGINFFAIAPCVTGKSNLYRRSDLDAAVGAAHGEGMEQFAKFLAEDQMISESLWSNGGRTAIAPDAALQPLGTHITLREFWMRRSRWIRLRKYMVTSATLVEPFTDCMFHNIWFSLIMQLSLAKFVGLCGLWSLIDAISYSSLYLYTGRKPGEHGFKLVTTWLARELLAFPLWLWAMSGRQIWWRNRPYKINRDLTAEAI